MDSTTTVIITIVNHGRLTRYCLVADRDELSYDVFKYWGELENKVILNNLLPEHVRTLGDIVDVEEIFGCFNAAVVP